MKMRRLIRPLSASTRPPISAPMYPPQSPLPSFPRKREPRETGLQRSPPVHARGKLWTPAFAGATITSCWTDLNLHRLSRVCGEIGPAVGGHELRPAPVEPPVVAFAVAIIARPSPQIFVEMLVSEAHLVTEEIAPGHHPSPGLGAALPIVHVVLLEGARWAEHPDTGQPNGFLDRGRGGFVGKDPRPDFGLVGSPRVPDPEGARGGPQHREIREESADDRLDKPQTWAEALGHFRGDFRLIGQNLGRRRVGYRIGADADDAVTISRGEHDAVRIWFDAKVAAR